MTAPKASKIVDKQLRPFVDADTSITIDPTFDYLGINVVPYMMQTNKHRRYVFAHIDTVFEVADAAKISNGTSRVTLFKQHVNINGVRVKTFLTNNKCVCCGIVGDMFVAERVPYGNQKVPSKGRPHLNLYARTNDGLMLMTVDHILADSLGGSYAANNFQTMCQRCNGKRGNTMSVKEIDMVLTAPEKYAKDWVHKDRLKMILEVLRLFHTTTCSTTKASLFNKFLLISPYMRQEFIHKNLDLDKIDVKLKQDATKKANKKKLVNKENVTKVVVRPGFMFKCRVVLSNKLANQATRLNKNLYTVVDKKINPIGYELKPGTGTNIIYHISAHAQKMSNSLRANCFETVKVNP